MPKKSSADNSKKSKSFGEWAEAVKKKNVLFYYAIEMLRHFFADNVTRASAELSYYLLFSIFPLLLLTSLLLSLANFSTATLLRLMALLPADVQKLLLPSLTRYLGDFQIRPRYGQMIFFSILAIYFMSRTMSSLMQHVNAIYGTPDARGGVRQFLFEIATAAGLVSAIVLSFGLNMLGRTITRLMTSLLTMPRWVVVLWDNGRMLIVLGFVSLFMLVLCYWTPNCKMRWRDVFPGALFIVGAWIICTAIFSFYFNNFANYDVIYGSIGAIMVLLVWLFMTGVIILLGFIVNYITMKRRRRDFIYKTQIRALQRGNKKRKEKTS